MERWICLDDLEKAFCEFDQLTSRTRGVSVPVPSPLSFSWVFSHPCHEDVFDVESNSSLYHASGPSLSTPRSKRCFSMPVEDKSLCPRRSARTLFSWMIQRPSLWISSYLAGWGNSARYLKPSVWSLTTTVVIIGDSYSNRSGPSFQESLVKSSRMSLNHS